MSSVSSPCINVCHMHAPTGWCEGCARSLPEIAAWAQGSDEFKRQVWRLLPARRLQLWEQFGLPGHGPVSERT